MPYKDKNKQKEYLKEWIIKHPKYHKTHRRLYHYSSKDYKRVVMKYLGFILLDGETVHHINGNPKDNRIENLFLFENRKQHGEYHASLRNWANNFPFLPIEEAIKTYPKLESNLSALKEEWRKNAMCNMQQ